jgi:uncharacterized C2H2 Zn-finger protein
MICITTYADNASDTDQTILCPRCQKVFYRNDLLQRHLGLKHGTGGRKSSNQRSTRATTQLDASLIEADEDSMSTMHPDSSNYQQNDNGNTIFDNHFEINAGHSLDPQAQQSSGTYRSEFAASTLERAMNVGSATSIEVADGRLSTGALENAGPSEGMRTIEHFQIPSIHGTPQNMDWLFQLQPDIQSESTSQVSVDNGLNIRPLAIIQMEALPRRPTSILTRPGCPFYRFIPNTPNYKPGRRDLYEACVCSSGTIFLAKLIN